MELILESPPEEVIKALMDGLESRFDFNVAHFKNYSPCSYITGPHPVYQLSLVSLINGGFLREAFLVSWRFMVLDNETATAAIEVAVVDSLKQTYKFARWNVGRYVESTMEGVLRAESITINSRLNLRLLQIPSLQLTALWLHGPNNPGEPVDFILPLVSPPTPVESYRLYTPDEILSILRLLADENLDVNDSTEPFG